MKRLTLYGGALLLLLACWQAAVADGCAVRPRAATIRRAVVETVVAPVAVAVTVPTYSASYQPGAIDQNAEILKALKALNDRLDRLEKGQAGGPVVPTPAAAPQAKALEVKPGQVPAVLAARCASCHQQGREKAGGGFVLLKADGTLASPDVRQWGLVATRTYLGEMPPKGGCTDEEVAQIQEYVRQQLR
jgi:mono/diheme cytochrome c family protein